MSRRAVLFTILLVTFCAVSLGAQTVVHVSLQDLNYCARNISTMYCFLPTFGLSQFQNVGLPPVTLPAFGASGTEFSVINNINSLVGTELSFLPLSSPASGIIFNTDAALGVVSQSRASLGPILSERAETLGRHKMFLAITYQHFGFDSFEGHSLKDTGSFSASSIDQLKVDQVTFFATYGLTSRVEVSAVAPLRRVRFQVSGFEALVAPGVATVAGVVPFTDRREASGFGDITLRVKGTVWRRERGGIAIGADLRTPTGKPLEFLGSGAVGFRPFVAASVGAKIRRFYIAPHVNAGFEFNGTSILGGPVVGREGRLPRRFTWTAGTEVGMTRRTTLTLDVIGQHLYNAERQFQVIGLNAATSTFDVAYKPTSVDIVDGSVGLKVNPVGNLVLTGNLTFKMNNGGLRARLVPLVGVSYTF